MGLAVVVGRGWTLGLGIIFGRHWKGCQDDLKVLGGVLPLEGSLDVVSGLMVLGTTPLVVSSSLIGTSFCFASLEGLLEEGRTSAGLSLLGLVFLEAASTWELGGTNAQIAGGIVDILCSPKSRGGLNPSLVEGLISHLEAINSTHAKDFSPEGILSLSYPHLITVLLSFYYGLLNLLQLLL